MKEKNCPCNKNCPERSIIFCPICEKGKEYKKNKLKEYENNAMISQLKGYTFDSLNKSIRYRKNFLNGRIK